MHDIDRTVQEWETELQELQPEGYELSEEAAEYELGEADEWEGAFEQEEAPETGLGEYGEYGESEGFGEYESESEFGEVGETGDHEYEAYESMEFGEVLESPLAESEEMELAAELLEVTNEYELDQFLGKLVKRIGRGVGRFAKSSMGKAIGAHLKGLAKVALPIAGKVLGGMVGGPAGAMLGSQLASTAGRPFGLELEGLSGEDREFEVARRFVRTAATATRKALMAPPTAPVQVVAHRAVAAATRAHAPGVGRPGIRIGNYPTGVVAPGSRRRGIWVRRGRGILLLGV